MSGGGRGPGGRPPEPRFSAILRQFYRAATFSEGWRVCWRIPNNPLKTSLPAALASLLTLTSVTVSAAPCVGASAAPHVAELSPAWRDALQALVASTQEPGMPWSCVRGTVDLLEAADGATLVVVLSNGERIEREVWAADEVVPLGQALLAAPLARSTPPAPPEAATLVEDAPVDSAAEKPATPVSDKLPEPRLRAGLVVAPRYAGNIDSVWGGVAADAAIPFGAWSFGVYGRYDALVIDAPPDSHFQEIALGVEVRRGFAVGPLVVEPSVRPSLAVVTKEGGNGHPEETRVDGRIGAALRLTFPLTERLRGVVLADGELSPSELDSPRKKDGEPTDGGPKELPFPSYTVGLGLGVEVSL